MSLAVSTFKLNKGDTHYTEAFKKDKEGPTLTLILRLTMYKASIHSFALSVTSFDGYFLSSLSCLLPPYPPANDP